MYVHTYIWSLSKCIHIHMYIMNERMNDNMVVGVRCLGGVVGIRTKAHKNTHRKTLLKLRMENIHSINYDEEKKRLIQKEINIGRYMKLKTIRNKNKRWGKRKKKTHRKAR